MKRLDEPVFIGVPKPMLTEFAFIIVRRVVGNIPGFELKIRVVGSKVIFDCVL